MKQSLANRNEDEFTSMAKKMSAWVDQVLGPSFRHYTPAQSWSPAINLYEDACCYYVIVDLAGVDVKRIDLRTDGGVLDIRGVREMPKPPTAEGQVRLHMMEIDHGEFSRNLELPENADTDDIAASYRGGFLSVRIPKKRLADHG